MTQKILIVEDMPAQRKLIERYLASKKYNLLFACEGEEALIKVKEFEPDLIILDLYLPDIDGIKVCEILKKDKETFQIPVIMVTARGSVSDIVNGLKVGADDYITKPYNHQELLARIEAVLRRSERSGNVESVIKKGGLVLLLNERKVLVNNEAVQSITRKEFDVLSILVRKSPQILNVHYLLQSVWGNEAVRCDHHTVETHIYTLRNKLGPAIGAKIVSIYGFGYKFEA